MSQRRFFWKVVEYAAALALVGYLIANFWSHNLVVGAVLVSITVFLFARPNRDWKDLVPFLSAAAIGPVMEMIVIYHGAWHYGNPTFAGIPFWLPILWGLSGIFFAKVSQHVEAAFSRPRPA